LRADRQRLDKWLVYARFVRTRGAALRLIGDGHVRIAGRRAEDGAQPVKIGDVLTLALAHATMVVRVRGLGERRGPYDEAKTLYEPVAADGTDASPDPGNGA